MTGSNPSPGRDPALPADKPKPPLDDIPVDVLTLAGLLHILDQYDSLDSKGRGAVMSLISVAAPLAWKIADDLEEVM